MTSAASGPKGGKPNRMTATRAELATIVKRAPMEGKSPKPSAQTIMTRTRLSGLPPARQPTTIDPDMTIAVSSIIAIRER